MYATCILRCAPCKAFSPILMKFYPICQQNNVEIIFISSDRTSFSFLEYSKTMPWPALPLLDAPQTYVSPSYSYSKALASKLSIRTIPQVVVLDCKLGNGDYITNDAKSQIESAWNQGTDDAFFDLIRSWKDAPTRVPLGQVKLGIVNSFFTKVQQGYKYVLGYSSSFTGEGEKDNSKNNNLEGLEESQSKQCGVKDDDELLVTALMEFFQQATAKLKVYPSSTEQRMQLIQNVSTGTTSSNSSSITDYVIPVSLEDHRRLLLKVQLETLEDTIHRIRKERNVSSSSLSTDILQEHLRSLGCKDFSNITSGEKIQQDLLTNMNEMNHHARNAFVRSVLWSEMQWVKCEMNQNGTGMAINFETEYRPLIDKHHGMTMDRKTVLEFCGLCNTAIKMEEVERYLKFGYDILDSNDKENCSSKDLSVHQRIILLQQLLLCAVGFEPNFGGQELHRITTLKLSHDDDEMKNIVASYFINMQLLAKNVGDDGDIITQGLSDVKDGGVTKVVSVKYSENSMDTDAPHHARMEHNSEERQREELKLAAKAASMQQEILDELKNMEHVERDVVLKQARESHELFVQQCMSLAPGPERIEFLQNVPPEQQKLLLIHKLWEGTS